MKGKKIISFGFLLAVFSCCATDTNRVWFTGPHSGSIILDTNTPIPTAEEIAKEDLSSMVLSEETNSLKSGVSIGYCPELKLTNLFILIRNGRVLNEYVCLAMFNTSTNRVSYWTPWPKNVESQFEINMLNDQGKPVLKTSFGKVFGQSPPQIPTDTTEYKAKRRGLLWSYILPKGDALYSLATFDPKRDIPRCFELEKPGNYKFTLIHHIYVEEIRTNGVFLRPITFSPVTVDVRVEK